jgi:CheY-like chemotaxis protein
MRQDSSIHFRPVDHAILMAEDNVDDIIITRRAWKEGNIKNPLHVVKDGEEALEFLYKIGKYKDAPTPSLMLLDINMPKMNGFEVLEKLKTDERHKKMPIIMLTTSEREKDIETAYNLGCNSYICKPVNFENFINAVIKIQQYWLILCKIP